MNEAVFLDQLYNYVATAVVNSGLDYRPVHIPKMILFEHWSKPGASTRIKIKLKTEARRVGRLDYSTNTYRYFALCEKIINIINYWQKTGKFKP